jgi:hypothetical protein
VEWGKRVTAAEGQERWRMQIHGLGHAPWLPLPNRTFGGDSAGVGEELERIRFGLWYDGASISFHRVISYAQVDETTIYYPCRRGETSFSSPKALSHAYS